jgi:hypothetical protein
MYVRLHVKYPLLFSGFIQNWIFWTDFRKIHKYQISWKSVQWVPSCSMQTDRHDETNSHFSQFFESAWKRISCESFRWPGTVSYWTEGGEMHVLVNCCAVGHARLTIQLPAALPSVGTAYKTKKWSIGPSPFRSIKHCASRTDNARDC